MVRSRLPVTEFGSSAFQELKQANVLFYKPFGPLESVDDSGTPARVRKLASIEQLLTERQWNEARRQSTRLIAACLEGLRYLETSACFILCCAPISQDILLAMTVSCFALLSS